MQFREIGIKGDVENKEHSLILHDKSSCFIMLTIGITHFQPYSKSKLELESKLGEILPVNCIASLSVFLPQLNLTKLKLE